MPPENKNLPITQLSMLRGREGDYFVGFRKLAIHEMMLRSVRGLALDIDAEALIVHESIRQPLACQSVGVSDLKVETGSFGKSRIYIPLATSCAHRRSQPGMRQLQDWVQPRASIQGRSGE